MAISFGRIVPKRTVGGYFPSGDPIVGILPGILPGI
jgi:hypothetical protein